MSRRNDNEYVDMKLDELMGKSEKSKDDLKEMLGKDSKKLWDLLEMERELTLREEIG